MKKIDSNGLILCDIQSLLFEESLKLNCSSDIFVRRFMNSKMAKSFDKKQILDDTLTINDIINNLEEEYGAFNYGHVKYEKNELNWIGHIYRYFSYTYDVSSKQVYKIIKAKELKGLYRAYHTFDSAYAIERILEAKNIKFDEDYTLKGLEVLRKYHNINTYYMKLWNNSFNSIKEQTKTIEMRLNDEKRSQIKINDVIVFTNVSTDETINTKVVNIYKYKDFEELYNKHDKISIGYNQSEEAKYTDMFDYYTIDEINKYGVLGIELKVLDNKNKNEVRYEKNFYN